MRLAVLATVCSIGFGLTAHAAPAAPVAGEQQQTGIVKVWGGCGWGFHPNRWGYCVPNHYGPPPAYWGGHYEGYNPYWRPWHRHYWSSWYGGY